MFYPRSGPLESYSPTLNARKHQIQKIHGCEILLQTNPMHCNANRVQGASVDTTAPTHDSVALHA